MIIWIANTPTPQFAPVLNKLHEMGLPIRAHYSRMGDGGRGWGNIDLSHPVGVVPEGPLRELGAGLWLGLDSRNDKFVVMGYAKPFSVGALLGARLRGKRVFTLSDSTIRGDNGVSLLKRCTKHALLRLLFGANSRAWAISEENEAYWRRYGVETGVRLPFESPVPAGSAPALNDYDGAVVLSVCRVVEEKGVLDFAAAIEELRSRGTRVLGVVAGPYTDAMEQKISGRLKLVGPVSRDELGNYYERADTVVLASWWENYGLVVREALQFGVPVVGTSVVPSIRALCDRGWNVVDPRDHMALAEAVERALKEGRWDRKPPVDISPVIAVQLRSAGALE